MCYVTFFNFSLSLSIFIHSYAIYISAYNAVCTKIENDPKDIFNERCFFYSVRLLCMYNIKICNFTPLHVNLF